MLHCHTPSLGVCDTKYQNEFTVNDHCCTLNSFHGFKIQDSLICEQVLRLLSVTNTSKHNDSRQGILLCYHVTH